jgi:ElaA protein
LRVVFPGAKFAEPSIGRVLTSLSVRRLGVGKALMAQALAHIAREYPGQPIRISAQQHLSDFYLDFGFEPVSEPYDEDGIPHLEMLRSGS